MRWVDKAHCDYPPSDAGKQCYASDECIEVCWATDEKDEDGYVIGTCGEIDCGNPLERKTRIKPQQHPNFCDVI